jgi:tetratricopeptide (TPR) repeat protein
MARFDKLEFRGGRKAPPGPTEPPRSERDEAYWIQRAGEARRAGLYENALKYYSRALEHDKSLVDGWVGQVQMLVLLEEFPEAELWSRKAMELFPSNGELLAGRAQAFCRMADLKQAHALSDGAMQQGGQSAYRWLVRGEIMVAGRQNTDVHCFDKAQQLDADWLVPLEIALVYCYYRCPSKALGRARRAVETAPDVAYAWYVQGLCQFELGLDLHARKSFRQCLDLCPRHADALARLSEMQRRGWSLTRLLRRLLGRP